MNPRVREAIENLLISAVPEEAKDEFRLRGDKIAKLCGEVAAGVCADQPKRDEGNQRSGNQPDDYICGYGDGCSDSYHAIRSEFDLGGNDGR